MKQQVFCVLDTKTQYFNLPFFQPTISSGQRLFHQLSSDKETLVGRYPADFNLIHVGEFDDETGQLIPLPHTNLGPATNYQEQSA